MSSADSSHDDSPFFSAFRPEPREHRRWIIPAVLGAAFVVFDTLPTAAITAWVPDPQAELVMAVLVAAKNPTVIAFTLIWMVAVVRAMVHAAMPADGASAGAASLDPSGATAQASARSDGGASTVGDIQNNGRRTQ